MLDPEIPRPRASLGRVLADMGTTLLDLVHGDMEIADDIGGVVIYDAADEPILPRRALVLGIGIHDPDDIIALLGKLGREEAAGLVLRAPVVDSPALREAAWESGVAVLALSRGAAWAQLTAMLRSLLAEGDVGLGEAETLGGIPSGDLFAVANAIAALLDAPVTIENRNSRVLAFSLRQDEADPSRVETVLGRRVPDRYARILTERGVFRDLYRQDEPVFVEPVHTEGDAFSVPRVAVAVRAGGEVLGSIWVAVRNPLGEERLESLRDAAKLVALHMLRVRAGEDVQRRLTADLMSTAMEGGLGAREALDRLGLLDRPMLLLGVALIETWEVGPPVDANQAHDRQRLSDAFSMHMRAVHPRAASSLIGDVTYGLVPLPPGVSDGEDRAVRIAADFIDRIGDQLDVLAGVSQPVVDIAALTQAKDRVDRTLHVLRSGNGGRRVARLSDVQVEALLMEMRNLSGSRGDGPTPPLARLLEHDAKHGSTFVETLGAWLDHLGDVVAASASIYVHPNTFRYRLRRLAAISGMDLTDSETRFNVMLQLRVIM